MTVNLVMKARFDVPSQYSVDEIRDAMYAITSPRYYPYSDPSHAIYYAVCIDVPNTYHDFDYGEMIKSVQTISAPLVSYEVYNFVDYPHDGSDCRIWELNCGGFKAEANDLTGKIDLTTINVHKRNQFLVYCGRIMNFLGINRMTFYFEDNRGQKVEGYDYELTLKEYLSKVDKAFGIELHRNGFDTDSPKDDVYYCISSMSYRNSVAKIFG